MPLSPTQDSQQTPTATGATGLYWFPTEGAGGALGLTVEPLTVVWPQGQRVSWTFSGCDLYWQAATMVALPKLALPPEGTVARSEGGGGALGEPQRLHWRLESRDRQVPLPSEGWPLAAWRDCPPPLTVTGAIALEHWHFQSASGLWSPATGPILHGVIERWLAQQVWRAAGGVQQFALTLGPSASLGSALLLSPESLDPLASILGEGGPLPELLAQGGRSLGDLAAIAGLDCQTDFAGGSLMGASLAGLDWSGANLAGINLRGATLNDADLSHCHLTGARLAGADLSGAYLAEANFRGADLRRSSLALANLNGTDLTSADLRGANLSQVNLRGAIVTGARFGENEGLSSAALGELRDRGALVSP
ncbi:MAG: hypothetical protein Fur0042_16260 [Cyanophyceae cyanobacterium]